MIALSLNMVIFSIEATSLILKTRNMNFIHFVWWRTQERALEAPSFWSLFDRCPIFNQSTYLATATFNRNNSNSNVKPPKRSKLQN